MIAGEAEECSPGTAIRYRKIHEGGVYDAFGWGGKKIIALKKAEHRVSDYFFVFFKTLFAEDLRENNRPAELWM